MSNKNYVMGISGNLIAAGIGWYIKGPNTGLIIAGAGVALWLLVFIFGRKEDSQHQPLPARQENTQTQNFNPSIEQHVHIIGHDKEAEREKKERERHDQIVLEYIKQHPTLVHLVGKVASAAGLTFHEVDQSLNRLFGKGYLYRDTIDAPGDFVYWYRGPELSPALAPAKDAPSRNIKFRGVRYDRRDSTPYALAIFENEFINEKELDIPSVKARAIYRGLNGNIIADIQNLSWDSSQTIHSKLEVNTPQSLILFYRPNERLLTQSTEKIDTRLAGKNRGLREPREHCLDGGPIGSVEIQLLTERELVFKQVIRFIDNGSTVLPQWIPSS